MLRAVLICIMALAGLPGAAAQDYPTRTIRIVVPYPPGGGTDVLARIIGQKLNERWGQPVVIENMPGASGAIGTRSVGRAEPDGYTLLMASTGAIEAASGMAGSDGSPFDVNQHFAPIALGAAPPYLVTVGPKVGASSIAELVRIAKEKPGGLTFGSSGIGAASHLAGELFQKLASVQLLHVAYRGTGPAVTDLMSGRLDLMFAPPQTVQPLVQSGELKALAITAGVRSPLFPNLPTVIEGGVPDYQAVGWFGLLAPAKTSPEIVAKLNGEVVRMMATAEVRDRLASLGAEPQPMSPAEFGRYINEDVAKWAQLVKEKGIVLPGSSGSGAR
jgi:tripartite-type tricarboxylate transporter receptor subunit TctC